MQQTIKSYHWLHVPTGRTGVREFSESQAIEARSILFPCGMFAKNALALLDKWNRQQPTVWKYWSA